MTTSKQIRKAIKAIEAQRTVLGTAVADTTLSALQDLLARQEPPRNDKIQSIDNAQRKQTTILFAKIIGFKRFSGQVQDTNILNVFNKLWRRLDQVIALHDGTIDKHIGDAVMGVFGVPVIHEDDPTRAIRAALQMRAALSDFVTERNETAADDEKNTLQNLRLSVGINTGPVLLGRVGESEETTVIGDAVNIASRLEQSAPPGSILISHDTYILVKNTFNVEPLGPVPIKGRSESVQVYLVLGLKPRLFYATGRGVEGVETRMVGRDTELAGLKAATQLAITNHSGRAMMIMGEAGVGKSRLVHEFNIWIQTFPQEIPILKGRTYQHGRQTPYALIRNLLATYFDIQDNDPASLAEEKLIQGMSRVLKVEEDALRQRVHLISRLIGLDLGQILPLTNQANDEKTPQLKELAYQYIVELCTEITAVSPAVIILLEDLHWADESSLDFLEHLLPACRQMPLLITMLSRPATTDQPLARHQELLGDSTQIIHLQSLSESESRELVMQILCKVPEIPPDLSDLIVTRAEGNPLYVEELIKILIEDGVIIAGQDEWQIRRNQLPAVRVPPHINGVLQARLDRLSELERATLQRAAVVGRVFWDSTVTHMNETAINPILPSETIAALQALEKREMIFRRQISGFAGTQAYVFKHAILHQVAYESVLLRSRPIYHKQVGDWLAAQSGERIAEYAGLVAEHFELAGEHTSAAELYEMAARRAEAAFDVELAIDFYRRGLSLLLDQAHYAEWLLRLQEQIGKLLHTQARFVEASQIYMTMRFTAEEDGDLASQARAWNGLAETQKEQGQYAAMLESASQAERVAWLIGAEMDLVKALLLQGEASLRQGEFDESLAVLQRALQLSDRQEEMVARTQSLHLLCLSYIRNGRYDDANKSLYQLQQQLALLQTLDELHAAAITLYTLGNLHNTLGQYDQATHDLMEALKLYRSLESQLEVSHTLLQLGETARLRGQLNSAIPFFRKAVSITTGINHRHGRMTTQSNLGYTMASLGKLDVARQILEEVLQLAENVSFMSGWQHLPQTYTFLADIYLAQNNLEIAREITHKAHTLAQKQANPEISGLTWRALGKVAAQQPPNQQSIQIGNKSYSAANCFAQSLRIFESLNGGGIASHRDQAYTLWEWAAFEINNNQPELGHRLQQRAQSLATDLDIVLNW
ncbi:MAG: tetratricopeptide repeat protein [Chloroflexi bacterium]|nr:tetratricopeptide repeat protein [Chloroflexota bacterium]